MKLTELALPGVFLLESPVWGDDRGFFREWFKASDFADAGINFTAQQANLSMSKKNTLRGLHYSVSPEGQAKAVTCVYGQLDDVIVDVRVGSPTFGQHVVVSLSANEGRGVYLPAGVAHGFCVTSDEAALSYLLSSPYAPSMEFEINPFDPALAIAWQLDGDAIVSEKDLAAPTLAERVASNELTQF